MEYKGISKPGHCMRCARKLDPSKTVWLELDRRTNSYTNTNDVPGEHSQGGFEFGPDCAAGELRWTHALRRDAGIPFTYVRPKTQGEYDRESQR